MKARKLFDYKAQQGRKADHRHYGEIEERYDFVSLETLVRDFRSDCTRLAGWRWH